MEHHQNNDAQQATMTNGSKILILLVSAMLIALCSCMKDMKHLSFVSIGHDGWAHSDTLNYTIEPLKGTSKCGVYLLLHTEGYAYSNIAFDICIQQDTVQVYHEQCSYLLAQNESKKGIGRRYDYTLPIGNIVLCDTLPTVITLTQRLDQPMLYGIRDMGICVTSPIRLPEEPVWLMNW